MNVTATTLRMVRQQADFDAHRLVQTNSPDKLAELLASILESRILLHNALTECVQWAPPPIRNEAIKLLHKPIY